MLIFISPTTTTTTFIYLFFFPYIVKKLNIVNTTTDSQIVTQH